MKVSLPVYLVTLFVAFVYAVIHNYFPTLPLTEEQIMWAVVAILTLLHVDVVNALRVKGLLG